MIFSRTFLVICILYLGACSQSVHTISPQPNKVEIPSLLLIPSQLSIPQSIKSVQLFKKGDPNEAPFLELGSNSKLILEFDELTTISGQFRVKFTHHTKNWEESGLPDIWVYNGVNELFIRGGEKNQLSLPDYFHYAFEFPNRDLKFKLSGNYLIHIYDFQSNTELFSLPFFVTENEGVLTYKTETILNQGDDGSAIDQLFGVFNYPDFVEFPQFNLSYSFVQNRFWKNAKFADQTAFITDGSTDFHLSRGNSFPANFDFSSLDLNDFSLQNRQIFNVEPARIPPRVILRDDFLNFLSDPRIVSESELGEFNRKRDGKYADVFFRLNTGGRFQHSNSFYLIGNFNQWSISSRNKLIYNSALGVFETRVLMKEGNYRYKYVTLENGDINDLTLSDTITKQAQEYIGFVYYRDPELQYDRLLLSKNIYSNY